MVWILVLVILLICLLVPFLGQVGDVHAYREVQRGTPRYGAIALDRRDAEVLPCLGKYYMDPKLVQCGAAHHRHSSNRVSSQITLKAQSIEPAIGQAGVPNVDIAGIIGIIGIIGTYHGYHTYHTRSTSSLSDCLNSLTRLATPSLVVDPGLTPRTHADEFVTFVTEYDT